MTLNLARLLANGDEKSDYTGFHMEVIEDVKEKWCYVAEDLEDEIDKYMSGRKDLTVTCKLPHEREITIDCERFKCTEILFQPKLYGMNQHGLHQVLNSAILACDPDLNTKLLYSNIVVTGGVSQTPGFEARLKSSL